MKKIVLTFSLATILFSANSNNKQISETFERSQFEDLNPKYKTPQIEHLNPKKFEVATKKISTQQLNKQQLIKQFNDLSKSLEKKVKTSIIEVTDPKEQEALKQLILEIKKIQASTIENNTNNPIKRTLLETLKNLTSKTAIVTYATIVCFAISQKIVLSGEITSILMAFRDVLEQFSSITFWSTMGRSMNIFAWFVSLLPFAA